MTAKIDLVSYARFVEREVTTVQTCLREKGAKRFQRAFIVAGALILIAYLGVYRPPQAKSARLQAEINRAKTMADYGAQYKETRDQLLAAYARLPADEQREQWLSNSVRDSLSGAGLVTEDFRPVREQEQNGLIFQISEVSLTLGFKEFFDWLLRLESARPLMHLQSLDLVKKPEMPGKNSASCEIATMIPKRRFR